MIRNNLKLKPIILRKKNVYLKYFNYKNITQDFLNSLNNKNINEFLEIKKNLITIKDAKKYFINSKKKNFYYFSLNSNQNVFFGTALINYFNPSEVIMGILIHKKKFWRTVYSEEAFQIILFFCFKILKIKKIISKIKKKNIRSIKKFKKYNFIKFKESNFHNFYSLDKKVYKFEKDILFSFDKE